MLVDIVSFFLKNTQCLAREELALDLRVVSIAPRAAVGVTITVVLMLQEWLTTGSVCLNLYSKKENTTKLGDTM